MYGKALSYIVHSLLVSQLSKKTYILKKTMMSSGTTNLLAIKPCTLVANKDLPQNDGVPDSKATDGAYIATPMFIICRDQNKFILCQFDQSNTISNVRKLN